jgi:hypothetical protein
MGLYAGSILFIKLSFLLLYRRLSLTITKPFRVAWWIVLVVTVGYSVPMIVVSMTCPSSDRPPFKQCISVGQLFIGHAVVNIVTDLAILILPIPAIWCMRLEVRQKAIVSVIFLIGSL